MESKGKCRHLGRLSGKQLWLPWEAVIVFPPASSLNTLGSSSGMAGLVGCSLWLRTYVRNLLVVPISGRTLKEIPQGASHTWAVGLLFSLLLEVLTGAVMISLTQAKTIQKNISKAYVSKIYCPVFKTRHHCYFCKHGIFPPKNEPIFKRLVLFPR